MPNREIQMNLLESSEKALTSCVSLCVINFLRPASPFSPCARAVNNTATVCHRETRQQYHGQDDFLLLFKRLFTPSRPIVEVLCGLLSRSEW